MFASLCLRCTALAVPHQHRRGGKATSCQSLLLLLLRVVVCYLLILSCSSRPVASKLCASLQRLPTLAAAAVAATHMLWFPLALPLDPAPLSVRSLVISVVVLIACSALLWSALAWPGLGLAWPVLALGRLPPKDVANTTFIARTHQSVSQSVRQSGSPSVSHPSRRVCLARRPSLYLDLGLVRSVCSAWFLPSTPHSPLCTWSFILQFSSDNDFVHTMQMPRPLLTVLGSPGQAGLGAQQQIDCCDSTRRAPPRSRSRSRARPHPAAFRF